MIYRAVVFAPWFGPVLYTRWLQRSVDQGRTVLWVIPSDQPQVVFGPNVLWVPDTLRRVEEFARQRWNPAVTMDRGFRVCDLREGFRALWADFGGVAPLWGWQDWDLESRLDGCPLDPFLCNTFSTGSKHGPLFLAPTHPPLDDAWTALLRPHHQAVDELFSAPRMVGAWGGVRHQKSMTDGERPYAMCRRAERLKAYGGTPWRHSA